MAAHFLAAVCILGSVLPTSSTAAAAGVVNTSTGAIRGYERDGVIAFLGVPFAAPPTGPRRFAPPVAAEAWSEVREPKPQPICVQAKLKTSEDCLYLNAFTTKAALETGSKLRPVMVFFHGGGFVAGGASTAWNLTKLTDTVVVLPQYRLGVMGFFSPGSTPQNFGMQDQQFALRWVQQNAKALGGDPKRVMIFGGSAGGASVAGHLVLKDSFGLYTSASIESPGGHQGWMLDEKRPNDDWMSAAMNKRHSSQLARELGCKGASDLKCLQGVSAETLFWKSTHLRFAPALAREGDYPLGLIRQGKWNRVPVLVGGQSCESCNDANYALGPPETPIDEQTFRSALIKQGFSHGNGSGVGPDTLEAWYASRIASEGRWRTFARVLGDSGHSCSTALHAEALVAQQSSKSPVWRYFFDYVDTTSNVPGATHGSEVSWVFDKEVPRTAAQRKLETSMAQWWANLAAFGNPNGESHMSLTWTQYSSDHLGTLFLDEKPHVDSTVDTVRAECQHWKPYLGWGKDDVDTVMV